MNISLTPQLEEFIKDEVRSGRYKSASEVVRAGLRLIQLRDAKLEAMRRGIQEGLEPLLLQRLESGEATPLTRKDMERVRCAVMQLLTAGIETSITEADLLATLPEARRRVFARHYPKLAGEKSSKRRAK